jgi:hypothetical protein
MADFPALRPTARSFQLGQYPVKTYRAMSGAVVRRSFGSRPYGFTLDLEFRNVPDATVNLIIDHYNTQGGGTLGFNIPGIVFAGYSSTVISKIGSPTGIEWLYAEPPSVSTVLKDISTITVKLVGEIIL